MPATPQDRPGFDGIAVVDVSCEWAGAFCARLLALLGAEVVRVVPSGGEPWSVAEQRHLQARKRLVDLRAEPDSRRRELTELAPRADMVIDDGALGAPAVAPSLRDELLEANPGLIVVAFSPFGLSGPKATWQATELTELASGGWLTSKDGAEPLMPGSRAAACGRGTLGALGAALALAERDRSGLGQLVEVPAQEAMLSMLAFPTTLFAYLGRDDVRIGDRHPYGIYRCADGHIGVSILTQRHWHGLCELMSRPDLAADPSLATGDARALPDAVARIDEAITAWAADRPALETFETGQAMRVPISIIPSPTQVLQSRHYAARDYWQTVDDPELGPLKLADRPFVAGANSFAPYRPAERGDLAELLAAAPPGETAGSGHGGGERKLPLQGVRVLDLTAWQAGPIVTMMLGDFGAEVLKFESASRLDGWRGSSGMMEDKAYERSPIWLAINRSKYGLSVDLATPAGKALFLRMVASADVVVENFTPRVMANFGLSYEVLAAINPRLVMIALSGFGATGPWKDFSAFAFPTEQVSGLTWLNGAVGGPPEAVGQSVTDALAGITGAVAVLAALRRRERSGHGEFIDLSQIETLTTFIGAELIDAQVRGFDPPRRGNQRDGTAPQGVFACPPPDDWLALSVRSDDEWRALCDVIDRPGLAEDASLASASGRAASDERVRVAITQWAAGRPGPESVELLQARDIPASLAMKPSMLMADEQLWARDFYRLLQRAEVDDNFFPGAVVRLSATPGGPQRPAPLFGEHTDEILARELGLSDAELNELRAAGVTSREPHDQSWR